MDNNSVIVDSKNEKQIIERNGINFKINDNSKPSEELLETLKDGEVIEQDINCGKRYGYSTINEMMESILND